MESGSQASRRVLVVEDAPVVAEVLKETLIDLGYEVVGPTGNLAVAVAFAEGEQLDAAVIDLNIRGGKVYPVARALSLRGIPFLVASGYGDWTMPEEWKGRPRLQKPFTAEVLDQKLKEILAPASP